MPRTLAAQADTQADDGHANDKQAERDEAPMRRTKKDDRKAIRGRKGVRLLVLALVASVSLTLAFPSEGVATPPPSRLTG